jgi:O-antigen/teichoic acid export membrane protein
MIKEISEKIRELFKTRKDILQGYIWRSIQTFGKQGSSFIIFMIATSLLPAESMGIYNYVYATVVLLISFADFGISTATAKYVAQYQIEKPEKVKNILFNSTILVVFMGVFVSFIVFIFGKTLLGEYYQLFVYISPLIFISPISSILDGYYRGLRKFKKLAIVSILIGLFSVSCSYFLISKYGILGALFSQNILYFLYIPALLFGIGLIRFNFDKEIVKKIAQYSLVFGIATLGYLLYSRVNTLILGEYGYFEEIAYYEFSNKIFNILILPFNILGQVLLPSVAGAYTKGKYVEIKNVFRKFTKIFTGIVVIAIPVVFILIRVFVHKFYPLYDNQTFYTILLPVLIIYGGLAFSGPVTNGIIVSTGHASLLAVINIVFGVLNVIVSFLLINSYGYISVIWTTVITQTLGIIILYFLYYKKLNLLTLDTSKSG